MRPYLLILCCLFLVACSSSNVEYFVIGESEFLELNGVKIFERTRDADNTTAFGVISDLHHNGDSTNAQKLRDEMKGKVDYILILGDTPLNEALRNGEKGSVNDEDELITAWSIFAELGIPILIMPGNHEGITSYNSAMKKVQEKYPNVIDLLQHRVIDLDDVSFIAVPGYHDAGFLPKDGYHYSQNDLGFIPSSAAVLSTPPILLSHGPPLSSGEDGIDYVAGVGNVGDPQLNQVMEKAGIWYSFSGHIHEAGPRANGGMANVGAGMDGHGAIIQVRDRVLEVEFLSVS